MSDDLAKEWHGIHDIRPLTYICGWCSSTVSSNRGANCHLYSKNKRYLGMDKQYLYAWVYICPKCQEATIVHLQSNDPDDIRQTPIGLERKNIKGLSDYVQQGYEDAKRCLSAGIWGAAAMLCRTLMMHIAVSEGAKEALDFKAYIKHLVDNNYIPKPLHDLADKVRKIGNRANHDITPITKTEAEESFELTEYLLQGIYDLPHRHEKRTDPQEGNS